MVIGNSIHFAGAKPPILEHVLSYSFWGYPLFY